MPQEAKVIRIGAVVLPAFPLLLAPMEDVSDPPFRLLCREQGADLVFSEFISSEGLIREADTTRKKLEFSPQERPVGLQIFGGDEQALAEAARIIDEVQPDLIDINFGCPVKKIVRKGAGAGVLKNVKKMIRLTSEVVKNTQCPVTVKTRLGWDEDNIHILYLSEALQDVGIQALSVHARTRTQMYKGKADWTWFEKIKNNPRFRIPLFGNGDITSPLIAWEYKNKYPVDGMMIGRASIGNPWIFNHIKTFFSTQSLAPPPSFLARKAMCLRHLRLSIDWKGTRLGILEMRRHYASYFKGLDHSKDLRIALNKAETVQAIEDILALSP